MVQLGELSSARQALEGAELAPGDRNTLHQLTDLNRRPPVPRDPIPPELLHHVPATGFKLDTDKLSRNCGHLGEGPQVDRPGSQWNI